MGRFSVKVVLITGLLCLVATPCLAKKLSYTPVLSVDSNYFLTPRNTNRAIANYALELTTGLNLLKTRLLGGGGVYSSFLNFLVSYAIAYSTFVMNHEFGHGSRSKVLGHTPTYGFFPTGVSGISNPFVFSLVAPIHIFRFAFTESTAPRSVDGLGHDLGDVIARGGMNNSAYLAETFEEHMWFKGGTRHWWVTYFLTKFDVLWYTIFEGLFNFDGGDPGIIAKDYKKRDVDVRSVDLRAGGFVSLISSFTLWNMYLFGSRDKLKTKNTWEFLGLIRWPDVSFYMNADGVSYKLSTGLSIGRRGGFMLFFPVAAERIHRGSRGDFDLTGGVRFDTSSYLPTGFAAGANVLVGSTKRGRGLGGRLEAEFRFPGEVNLTVGAEQFDLRTLHGERLTLNYGKRIAREAWMRFGFRY